MALAASGPTFANQRHNSLYIELLDEQQHYTSGDRVTGLVRVEPITRPVQIIILFRGYSIIHNKDADGVKPELFRFTRTLFTSTGVGENFEILRRGTADDGKVELPFDFTFPHTVRLPPPADRTWWYSKDVYNHPRFQHSPGFRLPPSCAGLESGTFSGALAPRVIYELEARMETRMLDNPKVKVRQDLAFIPSAPDYQPELLQPDLNFGLNLPKHCCRYKFIRTRKLLPDYDKSSKLGRLKDTLVAKEMFFGLNSYSEIPFARFNLFATPARILVLGAPIPVTVTVQHLDRSPSLPEPPKLFLRRVRVQLFSAFNIFVPSTSRKEPREVVDVARNITTLLDERIVKGDGNMLYNELSLLDKFDLKLTNDKILPSFTSYGLALEYELQVEIWGECADREFSGIACKVPVQLVSDWHVFVPQEDALSDADRPAYQEVDPMAAIHQRNDGARTPEPHAGGAVQTFDATTPAYEPGPRPIVQRVDALPPPPYAG